MHKHSSIQFLTGTCLLLALLCCSSLLKAQFVVDANTDGGDVLINGICADAGGNCTLRAAIDEANAQPGANTITFDVTMTGLTITIDAVLQLQTGNGDGTSINGDIDGDFIPDVRITRSIGPAFNGIEILGANNRIDYINIFGFNSAGNAAIAMDGATSTGNTVIGCYVGTDLAASGAAIQGNLRGIAMTNGADGNFIGDGTVNGRNVIGNNSFGIYVSLSDNNTIAGNIIGMDITGTVPIANGGPGIELNSAVSTTIGGFNPGDLNLITGNGGGIEINAGSDNEVYGNYIGTDLSGGTSVGNSGDGIVLAGTTVTNIIGDGSPGGGNVISGNSQSGIEINNSTSNSIKGNIIGLEADGITAYGNTGDGIFLTNGSNDNQIGGDSGLSEGNTLSENARGIMITTDANRIYGNVIGLTQAAGLGRGNSNAGIQISGDNNEVGDAVASFGNVISDNSVGILTTTTAANTVIEGNIIGLNGAGNLARGNLNWGIRLTANTTGTSIGDGSTAGANYISSNALDGISIEDDVANTTIDLNYIGTETDGVSPRGNGADGITIIDNSNGNLIRNSVITDNAGNGVEVNTSFNDNIISESSIFANGNNGISIGSGSPNPPSVDNLDPSTLEITGTSGNSATIEIFFDAADEGESYTATVTADGAGNWSYFASPTDFLPGLLNITATQLDLGYTSEFSMPFDVTSVFGPTEVVNTNDDGVGSLRWVIGNSNVDVALNTITFNIPTSDPGYVNSAGDERWTIIPLTALPLVTDVAIIDATTQPGGGLYRVKIDGLPNNLDFGLDVTALGTEIYGFFISGFAMSSTSAGIRVFSGGATPTVIGDVVRGNLIQGNALGISLLLADNTVIQGNIIGPDEDGVNASNPNQTGIGITTSASSTVIGGPNPGEGNHISGNTNRGININASASMQIEGNLIGTDISGLLPLGNGTGINIGTSNGNTIRNNVISANTGNAIELTNSDGNFFYDNKIGVGSDAVTPLGNDGGIIALALGVDSNTIGGSGAGESNIIANNMSQGILIPDAAMDFNQIIGNQIFCNGLKGIDLAGQGNDNIAPPVITNISAGSVSGTGINGDVIHVYRDNSACAPLQGGEYLGSTTVSAGTWTYADAGILAGDFINATATDASNNTSEFALNFGEIDLYLGIDNTGTPITDGQAGAVDFGTEFQGYSNDEIFAIENTSLVTLNVSSITITGTAFSVIGAPTTVPPGATVNFTIRLSGAGTGSFTETVTILNDDEDEGTFDFPVTGMVLVNPAPDPLLVTNTDPGSIVGSLRTVIAFANGNAGADIITFDPAIQDQAIILDGPITITDDQTTIDGDMVGDCVPHITISGAGITLPCIGNACIGLIVDSNLNTIKHLNVQGFVQGAWGEAIRLNGSNNTVIGCYIGTDLSGTDATGSRNYVGIRASVGSSTNTIGGLLSCESNTISGNDFGIAINEANNVVLGNFIGTDPSGTSITNLGNFIGVSLSQNSTNTVIGSTNPNGRNIISGNSSLGIEMTGVATQNNVVIGNYIGTDASGTVSLPNSKGLGIYGSADNNQIGDGTPGGRNIISGNTVDGIDFQASGTTIVGNYIGTDVTGTLNLGNGQVGVNITIGTGHIIGGTNPGEGNVISGNGLRGINLRDNNFVYGNKIGTNEAGTASVPNGIGIHIQGANNQIGDGTLNGLNVISGNLQEGILDWGGSNTILMNYFGVQVDGLSPLGNGLDGIEININGNDLVNFNIIANNSEYGIDLRNTGAVDGNTFSQNSIYSNALQGIRIVPPSQAGILPPVVTSISATNIDGTSDNGATIEVFADSNNQGEFFIGSTVADGAGNWSLAYVPASIPAGLGTATAIQTSGGNSSEFSVAASFNNALDFDGSNDVVDMGDVADFDGLTAITVEGWINPRSYPGAGRIRGVVNKSQINGPGTGTFHSYFNEGNGGFHGSVGVSGTPHGTVINAADNFPLNEWTHFAFTWSTGNALKIYVNGKEVREAATTASGSLDNVSFPFRIGESSSVLDDGFDGQIDEVRIWDIAKSEAQIQTDIFNQLTGGEPNLISYYDFNQGLPGGNNVTVTTLSDLGPGSNDGTLTNFGLTGPTSNWVASGAPDETPNAPINLVTTEISSNQVDLSWTECSFNETGYTIERSDGNNSSFTFVNSVGPNVTTFSDNTVTSGNGYFYRVIATGVAGDSDPSNEKFGSTIAPPGNSLHFSGDDDYVNAGEFMPQSYTKEAWVRIESGSDRNNFISSDDIINGHYIYAPIVNSYHLSAGHFDGGALTSIIDVVPLDFDKWYHVAVSYDAGTQDMILYKNGQVVGNQTVVNHSDPTVLLGSHNFLNLLTGNLDEVRIWDDVRTPAEIQNNLFNTLVGNETNLVAYYRFDQGIPGGDNTSPPIDILPDRSINNNNGTLNNFTLNGLASNWVISQAMTVEAPMAYNGTEVTETDFIANFSVPASIDDILIDVADNPSFVGPLIQDMSVGLAGSTTITLGLVPGTDYYFRVRSQQGGAFSTYSASNSFRIAPGNALDFDGVDDYVVVADAPSLDITGDITISAWIFPEALDGAFRSIVGKFGPEPEESYYFGIQNDQLVTNLVNDGVTDDSDLSNAGVISAGKWQHVAFTLNATSTLITYYVDGAIAGTANHSGGLSAGLADIFIGWQSNGDNSTFNGSIDELRIWSIERTQAEIQNDMFKTMIGNESGLAAYYRFDHGTDGVINTGINNLPDLGLNLNDGTLTNFDLGLADVTNSNWKISFGPEIEVFQGFDNTGIPLTDGQVAPVDFGSGLTPTDIDIQFAIENSGPTILTISGITITGDPEFTVLGVVPGAASPGATVNFDIRLSGATPGVFNATVEIASDDADEATFDFPVTGSITLTPEPEISVFVGVDNTGTPVADGQIAAVDIGSSVQGTDLDQVFAIENIGSAVLNIGSISVGGGDFTVISGPGTVGIGATQNFTLRLDATNTGTFVDNLTIVSDDTDEGTFDFPISGSITAAPAPEIAIYEGPTTAGMPVISGQATAVNFGAAPLGTDLDMTFTVENTGTSDLNITLFANTGPDFFLLSGIAVPISPGGFDTFTYRLSDNTAGTFNDVITITNDDPDEGTFTFPITGTITAPDIKVFRGVDNTGTVISNGQAAIVDFGSTIVGTPVVDNFVIENTGNTTLNVSGVTVSSPDFTVLGAPVAILAGNIAVFQIQFNGISVGGFSETVSIASDDPDEANFLFPVGGAAFDPSEPEIQVFQGIDNTGIPVVDGQGLPVDFGNGDQGIAIDRTFAIENVGTADLNVTSVIISDVAFEILEVTPITISPGNTELITLRLSGIIAGTFSADIQIINDDSDEGLFDFPVTGTINSLLPEIRLFLGPDDTGTEITDGQSAVIDLGSTNQNVGISQSFTIRNEGNGTLTINGITFDNIAYSSGSTPGSVAPGTNSTFSVDLDASSQGVFATSVNIQNNDGDENPFDFQLTAEVVAPLLLIKEGAGNSGNIVINGQPAPIDFGSTPQFNPIERVFSIDNTGSSDLAINLIGSSDANFEVLDSPVLVSAGDFEEFTIRLNALQIGIFNANITMNSSLGDYAFPVTGEVTDPGLPPIEVFNAISPNGDGFHDYLRIRNIEVYTGNRIFIYTKMGELVFRMDNYFNQDPDRRFEGIANEGSQTALPDGTYYYLIDPAADYKPLSGFFVLKR